MEKNPQSFLLYEEREKNNRRYYVNGKCDDKRQTEWNTYMYTLILMQILIITVVAGFFEQIKLQYS